MPSQTDTFDHGKISNFKEMQRSKEANYYSHIAISITLKFQFEHVCLVHHFSNLKKTIEWLFMNYKIKLGVGSSVVLFITPAHKIYGVQVSGIEGQWLPEIHKYGITWLINNPLKWRVKKRARGMCGTFKAYNLM